MYFLSGCYGLCNSPSAITSCKVIIIIIIIIIVHDFSPGLSSGVAGERRAGLDCTDCTEGVRLTVEGSGCSMGDRQ